MTLYIDPFNIRSFKEVSFLTIKEQLALGYSRMVARQLTGRANLIRIAMLVIPIVSTIFILTLITEKLIRLKHRRGPLFHNNAAVGPGVYVLSYAVLSLGAIFILPLMIINTIGKINTNPRSGLSHRKTTEVKVKEDYYL